MKLSALTPDTRNANKGTDRGRKLVRESLKRYGAGRSILIDKSGNVIAGNKTLEGAKAVGLEDCQVVKSDGTKLIAVQRTDLDINDKAARELAIADNRASELGLEWDADVLKALETEVDVDLSPFWDERELVQFWAKTDGEAPEPKFDEAEALQERWQTQYGQIWAIPSASGKGNHRLLCGSATNADDHARVLNGDTVDAVVTDPPYGVGIEYGKFVDSPENVRKLIGEIMPLLLKWPVVAISTGVRCLWDYPKPTWLLGWALSRATGNGPWGFTCFHPVLVWGNDPYLKERLGGRPDTSVELQADREGQTAHPTIKPIAWWNWLVERVSTKPGRVIFDPFNGSGTTLVSCEMLGRLARCIELEPKYIAVALQRMADMGLKPELTHA